MSKQDMKSEEVKGVSGTPIKSCEPCVPCDPCKTEEELKRDALKSSSEVFIRHAIEVVTRRRLESISEDVLQAELDRRNPKKV